MGDRERLQGYRAPECGHAEEFGACGASLSGSCTKSTITSVSIDMQLGKMAFDADRMAAVEAPQAHFL